MGSTLLVRDLKRLWEALRQKRLTIAVAESCTGGLLGSLITDFPGSSDYFLGGVTAYGNRVKEALLGVKLHTLARYGAVSPQTAREMADGVRDRLKSDIGISVTGIAGPGGGSARKPVGTVYIAVSRGKKTTVRRFLFKGKRAAIKRRSALSALSLLGSVVVKGRKI